MNKKRLAKLEASMIPPGAFMVVWQDPDKEGVYYDSPAGDNRKTYTEADLKPLRDDPQDVLIIVRREDLKI
jgi:hypothetical protein